MAYSFAQLEGLWEQAGGSHALAPVMAAIALAESGGNPNATGGVGEKGLWQINPHAWGSLATYDPLGNARAAVHVEHAQGLTAWTTFNTGAYKHFLGSAKPVIPPGSVAPGAAKKVVGAVTKTGQTQAGGSLGGFFSSIWDGLKAGLGVSAASGNEPANALIGSADIANASDVAQAIAALTLPFTVIANALDWFFVPSHWVRIIAGISGIGLAGFGAYELVHTGQDKPAALPVGMASVGLGGVLLFVAFHNLPSEVKTPGEFLSHLQGQLQTAGGTSPAAAVTAAGGGG